MTNKDGHCIILRCFVHIGNPCLSTSRPAGWPAGWLAPLRRDYHSSGNAWLLAAICAHAISSYAFLHSVSCHSFMVGGLAPGPTRNSWEQEASPTGTWDLGVESRLQILFTDFLNFHCTISPQLDVVDIILIVRFWRLLFGDIVAAQVQLYLPQ